MIAESITTVDAPREAVIASAGSGKTFRISSRIIGLIAHGAPIDSILASTFTRKAAGQILEVVLERLAKAALSRKDAAELALHASLGEGHVLPDDPSFWAEQLEALVRMLHRTSVGTLDSFFVGIARVFAHELGLPPGWRIADEPAAEQLRSDVLQEILAADEPAEIAKVLDLMNQGQVRRSIHDHLMRLSTELLEIHDDLDPSTAEPWEWDSLHQSPPPPDAADLEDIARTIEELEMPLTKSGQPRRHWSRALNALPGLVRSGDWDVFLKEGLVKKVIDCEDQYDRDYISDECREVVQRAIDIATGVLRTRLALRLKALGTLGGDFSRGYREAQMRNGVYGFQDITRLLADGQDALGQHEHIYFRLDARVGHLLLDEFQDTSLGQWKALEPLVEEVLSEPGKRAAVIVADPKQSIYGWRGGEPAVVHHVEERYRLDRQSLAESWRSSRVLLDFVNEVFEKLPQLPTAVCAPVWEETVNRWSQDYERHRPAKPLASRRGYVEVSVGPCEDRRSRSAEPVMCRQVAERVADLHREMPHASIGVLVATNATVARMIVELKQQGIQASEEGGMPLTNAASCEAVLALLHLADHPNDTVARYHVARSPLGRSVGLTDGADGSTAASVAQRVRSSLAEEGYGRVIDGWMAEMRPHCDRREWRRLTQLGELAYAADERAPLRPTDFVRLVESKRIEDPSTAPVRVMTVHKSKGLQFDVVVLPELDRSLGQTNSSTQVVAHRTSPTERATSVVPLPSKPLRPLFPELSGAIDAAEAMRLRDDISSLYVALTRARYAMYIMLREDSSSRVSSARSSARLIREALADAPEALDRIALGDVLYEEGDPDWYLHEKKDKEQEERAPAPAVDPRTIALARPPARRRLLSRMSPSSLQGGSTVTARSVLRIDSRRAMARGSIVHAWCELISWIDDGVPSDEQLLSTARRVDPAYPGKDLKDLMNDFRKSLAHPDIRRVLDRASYPENAELLREEPLLHREDGRLVEGVLDRLVVLSENGAPVRAEIIDFKTDLLSDDRAILDARVDNYRPQMKAYVRATAARLNLPPEAVTARLLFLDTGDVVKI